MQPTGWAGAMGLRMLHLAADRVELEWTVGPEHLQPFGIVHGAVFSGVVETVCSVGAALGAAAGKGIVGMENHTSFLRPVRSGTLRAVGTPVHSGRSTALWEAQITDSEGRLIASGRLRMMLIDAPVTAPGG
jgi:1,4-dihydroxy-2-naphthoyl-CoA hydrolase